MAAGWPRGWCRTGLAGWSGGPGVGQTADGGVAVGGDRLLLGDEDRDLDVHRVEVGDLEQDVPGRDRLAELDGDVDQDAVGRGPEGQGGELAGVLGARARRLLEDIQPVLGGLIGGLGLV